MQTQPVLSATSLPVRPVQPASQAAPAQAATGAPVPTVTEAPGVARRGRPRTSPIATATRAGAIVEPDPELLLELGRLFWAASSEGGTPTEVAMRVVERLAAAKRLGELATLLGV